MPHTTTKAAPNGAAGPIRRQEPDTDTIALNGKWAGWEFRAYVNPTWGELQTLGSERLDPTLKTLGQLILSWNYVDRRGNELPPPADGGWDDVGLDLIRATVLAYIARIREDTDVPKN